MITNDTVFVSATEAVLYDGCDFRAFWAMAALCFFAGVALFCIFPLPQSLYGIGVTVFLFFLARWALREIAKSDPLAVPIYMRHIRWPVYLPPVSRLRK